MSQLMTSPVPGSDLFLPVPRGSLRSPRANHDDGPPGLMCAPCVPWVGIMTTALRA